MCGRVAAVSNEPVFAVVRTALGDRLGLFTLIASNLLNLLTCTAELGAIGIILHLSTGWNERLVLILGALILGTLVWVLKFEWIERIFGLWGLLMIVFAVAAWKLHPDWPALATHLIPQAPVHGKHETFLYAYFAVGIFSAMLMEYEVHFYSSGAIEEDWKPKDLSENFMVASLGCLLGSLLTVGLVALGAVLFLPRNIFPQQLSTAILAGSFPFAKKALVVATLG